jgi:hypothetical protein
MRLLFAPTTREHANAHAISKLSPVEPSRVVLQAHTCDCGTHFSHGDAPAVRLLQKNIIVVHSQSPSKQHTVGPSIYHRPVQLKKSGEGVSRPAVSQIQDTGVSAPSVAPKKRRYCTAGGIAIGLYSEASVYHKWLLKYIVKYGCSPWRRRCACSPPPLRRPRLRRCGRPPRIWPPWRCALSHTCHQQQTTVSETV